VAVVAGATRGAGRGIAAALGEAGATVVCTGRSSNTGSLRSDYERSETIEETAEIVTQLGGTGVASVVDHLDTTQVEALAERIRHDHGHVDVLMNDIGAATAQRRTGQRNTPIWDHDLDKGHGYPPRLRHPPHHPHHLLPLLIDQPGGLHVEVTDGTTDYNASRYRLSVFYDLAKVAVNRLAFSQGHELAPHGATAVAITPGWLRSEMMLDNFGVSEANWRDALHPAADDSPSAPPDFALSESPRYVGRAVVAVATDPTVRVEVGEQRSTRRIRSHPTARSPTSGDSSSRSSVAH
jgi:NAD(P)-dependent dehydrogenase (short-subunit alcohol dehydrogenase family)